jgi:phosphoribosylformylglycinamidine (FGAM) synthase PurS component
MLTQKQQSRFHNEMEIDQQIEEKRKKLQTVFADRLLGNPKDIKIWQRILSIRRLIFSNKDDLTIYIKFIKIALKQNHLQIAKRILTQICEQVNPSPLNEFDYPP